MTFLRSISCLVLAAGALAPGASNAAGQAQNPAPERLQTDRTFTIAGTVVSATTGAGLAQSRVTIRDTTDRSKATSMVTSSDGHFAFPGVPAGKYALEGAKRGFLASAYEQHEQFSTAIVTGEEFPTDHLVLRLTPMAMITGHVSDEFGEPVRNASVGLFAENHGGGMSGVTRVHTVTSDDRGYYEFGRLRPGRFYVSVTTTPWYAFYTSTAAYPRTGPGQPSSSLDVAYPTTYFDGSTEADGATPIEVKGGDRPQIDVHLSPVPALHLIFRGPENETRGPDPPTLRKNVFDSVEQVPVETQYTSTPGVFELTGIPPGRYTVLARNPASMTIEQSTAIDLVRDGQDLGNSTGEALGKLKLTLKPPGEETLPKQYVVGLRNARGQVVDSRQGDLSGQVTLEDLAPGKYSIVFFAQEKPYAVVRTSSPTGSVSGHDVMITSGATEELTAYLSTGTVSIEGVAQKKGKPVAGVMVALVPNDPQAHVELFRRDQSDLDGTFVVRGVIPGSYTIVAVEDAWGFQWLEPGVLARYVKHGQNLAISERTRGTVHLPDPVEVQPH